MPFVTVLGHSNIDVQIRVGQLPKANQSSPALDRHTVYGGTACNIARHAAGLGVGVRLWSRVGKDMPLEWKAALQDDGVQLALDVAGRTPTCFIFTDAAGDQAYCMDQGAMSPPYDVPASVLDGATWLHVSTGDPGSYRPIVEAARAAGVKVAFDPGQEIHFAYDAAHFEQLLDLSDVFFCNDAELEVALRFMRYGDAEQLLDHVDAVVATHGADGATLHRVKHKPLTLAALPAEVIDATGAGDALRAGWYAGLAAGQGMPEALQCGIEAASLVVAMQGPQPVAISASDLASLRRTS